MAILLGSRAPWVQNLAGHSRKHLLSAPPSQGPRWRRLSVWEQESPAGRSADHWPLQAGTLPRGGS